MKKDFHYINASFALFQKTGDMKPFLQDLKKLAVHFCEAMNLLPELNDGDFWQDICERVVIALKIYDPAKGKNPFSFFWGVIYKHCWLHAVKKGRKKHTVDLEALLFLIEDGKENHALATYLPEIEEKNLPFIQFLDSLKIGCLFPGTIRFLDDSKVALTEGRSVAGQKSGYVNEPHAREKAEEIDEILVRIRRQCLKIWG